MLKSIVHFVGGAVCHQLHERTIIICGDYLPVCARCTGIYLSIFISFIFLFCWKRISANKPLTILSIIFITICFSFLMFDGVTSYIKIRETTNFLRILSGSLMGIGLPILYVLIFNFDVNGENIYQIANIRELFILTIIGISTANLIYFGIFRNWYIISLIICFSIFLIFFGVCNFILYKLFKIINIKRCIISTCLSIIIIFVLSQSNNFFREVIFMQTKDVIRKIFLENRNSLSFSEITERSVVIQKKLLETNYYSECEEVFCYVHFNSEVETDLIINDAIKKGKRVATPYMIPKTRDMYFIEIKNLDNLVRNKYGILEPVFKEENIIKSGEKTLIVVPGAAFDKNNYRIGYGGGFYDKYLYENVYINTVGLFYDFQRTDALPVEQFDKQLDYIITD